MFISKELVCCDWLGNIFLNHKFTIPCVVDCGLKWLGRLLKALIRALLE